MEEQFFSIYGVGLQFTTNFPRLGARVARYLDRFRHQTVLETVELQTFLYEVQDYSEIPFPPVPLKNTKGVRDESEGDEFFTFFRNETQLVFDFHEHGFLLIDEPRGHAQGYLVNSDTIPAEIITYYFHHCFREPLRSKGLYTVHAAVVEKNGKGVVISGPPNQGKTTTSISLLRAGYRLIADDFPLLREKVKGVELLNLRNRVAPRSETLDFFPELKEADLAPDIHERYTFQVKDLYPQGSAQSCHPIVLLFPHVIQESKSYLEPVPKFQALKELIPQGLKVINQEVAKMEFRTYSRLVEQVACFRLYFGQDFEEIPQLINPLME